MLVRVRSFQLEETSLSDFLLLCDWIMEFLFFCFAEPLDFYLSDMDQSQMTPYFTQLIDSNEQTCTIVSSDGEFVQNHL